MLQKTKYKSIGFSLIELSIVVVILGLMIGGIMSAMTQESRRTKKIDLATKMDAIEQAIYAYVKKNNRLPCPADGTYLITDTFFGVAPTTPCTLGATYNVSSRLTDTTPPTSNFMSGINAAPTNVGGVVPVRSLGLPDEYAFDPWGGRFTYIVYGVFTGVDSFTTYSHVSSASYMTVADNAGNTVADNAMMVIISHGENGHGAYQLSGSRKNSGSTNANELVNCHCTSGAVASAFATTFHAGNNTTTTSSDLRTNYDDITRYYTRGSFLNSTDIKTEIK